MAEKIILSFTGWCECNPDKVNFVKTSPADGPEVITGREWLELQFEDWESSAYGIEEVSKGSSILCRDDYTLEDTLQAQQTALDGSYTDWWLDVEEE
jgi:hypothetical protein